jgi:uncharacterized protein YjbI with pentapeptide repeats
MTDSDDTASQQFHLVESSTLTRNEIEHLIASTKVPLHFADCDFEGADLSRLDLRSALFERCTIAETSFFGASLSHTVWRRCRRGGTADFTSADLVDATFESSDLNNTKWGRAKLASVSFRGCKLTGANFEGCSALGLSFADTLLVGAHLRRLSFRKANLVELNFSDADLAGCDFREAVFDGGSLKDANLKDARFDGADLRTVDLSGLTLSDAALFRGAIISWQQAAGLVEGLGLRVQ